MADLVVVGEGMVELSPAEAAPAWRLGYGGDTLNIAIHLARLGHGVGFLSALGTDPFSAELRAAWASERLDPAFLLTDPTRRPGLYAIANDIGGERRFTYWRSESAARQVFALPGIEAAVTRAERARLLVFSLISLAILPPSGRDALLDLAARVRRRGGQVAFDTNYRPALWPDLLAAREARARALAVADIGLPTLEDEAALIGSDNVTAIADAWRSAGVDEVALKCGVEGCVVDGEVVPPPARLAPVDTSGAGDAFNAGYLHARLKGQSPLDAARAGHQLAGWSITRRGAIPEADCDAPYAALASSGQTNLDSSRTVA